MNSPSLLDRAIVKFWLVQNFTIALSSKDGEFISRVVGALNEALVARG